MTVFENAPLLVAAAGVIAQGAITWWRVGVLDEKIGKACAEIGELKQFRATAEARREEVDRRIERLEGAP